MWTMEIVNEDEVVARHNDVSVRSKSFFVEGLRKETPGFEALDRDGKPIEYLSGDESSMWTTSEGLVCVAGLWTHLEDIYGREGYYHGIKINESQFMDVEYLADGINDSGLKRQWNLRFEDGGSVIPIASPALAVVETPPLSMHSVAAR